jgi:hypothetical protein
MSAGAHAGGGAYLLLLAHMSQGSRLSRASPILAIGGSFSWMILAQWMILWTGMHKTFREAQIFHGKRRQPGGFYRLYPHI